MIYFAGWLYLIVISLGVSIVAFLWAYRSGQFSDQDRARYLPLGEDLLSVPAVTASRRQKRIHSTAFLIIAAMGLIVFGIALAMSIHNR